MRRLGLMRPPIDPPKMIRKCLWTGACFLIGLFLIANSIFSCQDFRVRAARAVAVKAVVSDVKEVTKDESVTYNVYVRFDYEGSPYTLRYATSSREEWMDRIGETVTVVVDSQDPNVKIDDLVDGLFFSFFFGLPIFALGFCTAGMQSRKTYVEEYGKTSVAVIADQIVEERSKLMWVSLAVYSLGNIAWGFYIADIDGIFAGAILLGVMAMPFAIVFLVRYIVKQVRVRSSL